MGTAHPHCEEKKMTGWKTWTAGIGMIVWGVTGAIAGMHTPDEAASICLQGVAVLGLGHKLDKQTQALKGD